MSDVNPSPAAATTSTPASARKPDRPAVRSAVYGVAVAILVRSRCRSAASSAPLVVTAAGAPASVIADTSAASPARPPTKLPDVHA